jgi:hypothetical protein
MSLETMMVNSFVAYYKAHNRVPDRINAANPADWGLVSWLEEQVAKYKNGKKGKKLDQQHKEILEKAGVYSQFLDVVRPNHHIKAAKDLVAYIQERDIKSPLRTGATKWKRHRNWFYAHTSKVDIQHLVSNIFESAGFPNLESAGLNSNELKEVIFIKQAIDWKKKLGKLPCPSSKNPVEKQLGELLQSNLHSYSYKLLKHHDVTVPSMKKQVGFVSSNSSLEQRVVTIESMLNKLTQVVEILSNKILEYSHIMDMEPQTKKVRKKTGAPLVPVVPNNGPIDSSNLIGLAVYNMSGKDITVGIENVITYEKGTKKYILRMPSDDGKSYTRKFFRWETCKNIKQVMLNK